MMELKAGVGGAHPRDPDDLSPPPADEVDLVKYGPPEALNVLPDILPNIVLAIVRSSVKNVWQQVEAERQRLEDIGRAVTAPSDDDGDDDKDGDNDGDGDGRDNISEMRKGKRKASGEGHSPSSSLAGFDFGLSSSPSFPSFAPNATNTNDNDNDNDNDKPSPRRPRFGISRILRYVVGEGNDAHVAAGPNIDAPAPTFTQFVYKHLKPAASGEAGASV